MVDVRLHKALPALSRKELSAHAALAVWSSCAGAAVSPFSL